MTSDAGHSLQFAVNIWQRFQMPTLTLGPNSGESDESIRAYLDSRGLTSTRLTRSIARAA
jgi:hypothetical protein